MIKVRLRQKVHDECVAFNALILRKKGHVVFADLPGFTKPPILNGRIPDIYAIKRRQAYGQLYFKEIVILEVETKESKDTIETFFQHLSFKAWASNNGAKFIKIIAD